MPQEVYTENGIADLTGRKIENPQRLQPALLLLLCMGEGDSGNSDFVPNIRLSLLITVGREDNWTLRGKGMELQQKKPGG